MFFNFGVVMARTKAQLSAGARLADYLTVGYLAMRCPLAKVRETLAQSAIRALDGVSQ